MSETENTPQQDAIDVPQLARAIRFALVALVLGISYLSLRSSFAIRDFSQIFADMLGGRPLPALATFVIGARPFFVAVSVLVPIIAFGTLFLRGLVRSFYIIGALGFITIAQFITLYYSLSAPLFEILNSLGAGTPP